MRASRMIGLLLLLATLPSLWLEGRFAVAEIGDAPREARQILDVPLEQRERRALQKGWDVPALFRTEELLRPVLADAGVLEVTFTFVAPGSNRRAPALRGATVLNYLLAPRCWVLGPPLEDLRDLLSGTGPPGEVLAEIARSSFILFAGVGKQEVLEICALAARRFGRRVLVPGRDVDDDLHVALRFDVAAALAAGDPRAERYRPLLGP